MPLADCLKFKGSEDRAREKRYRDPRHVGCEAGRLIFPKGIEDSRLADIRNDKHALNQSLGNPALIRSSQKPQLDQESEQEQRNDLSRDFVIRLPLHLRPHDRARLGFALGPELSLGCP
jgi:hypothetical protein